MEKGGRLSKYSAFNEVEVSQPSLLDLKADISNQEFNDEFT